MDWKTVISCLSSALASAVAVLSLGRLRGRDARDDAGHDAAVLVELGYIKSGIEEVRTAQMRMSEQYGKLASRVAVLEASDAEIKRRLG